MSYFHICVGFVLTFVVLSQQVNNNNNNNNTLQQTAPNPLFFITPKILRLSRDHAIASSSLCFTRSSSFIVTVGDMRKPSIYVNKTII